MLPLRKGLFSREEQARVSATRGLLLLAELGESQSLESLGVPVEESMGLLRRCFQSPSAVRSTYYMGLVSLYETSSNMREEVLGALMQHLERYCTPMRNAVPPLLLSRTLERQKREGRISPSREFSFRSSKCS